MMRKSFFDDRFFVTNQNFATEQVKTVKNPGFFLSLILFKTVDFLQLKFQVFTVF